MVQIGFSATVTWKGDEYVAKARGAVQREVARTTKRIEKTAKMLTSQHHYPPSSEQDEPPHMRTGTLTRNITSKTVNRSFNFLGIIGFEGGFPEYHHFLEFGWTDKRTGKFHIRPFLRPAYLIHRERFKSDTMNAMVRIGTKEITKRRFIRRFPVSF